MFYIRTWRSISLKTVVTGGAGFIGSHLCTRLLDEGHSVLCIDNLITGSERNIAPLLKHPQFTFTRHDVTAPFEFEADAIFHLASPASPVENRICFKFKWRSHVVPRKGKLWMLE